MAATDNLIDTCCEELLSPVDVEYDLTLANDVHTRGNTQWFYFSLSGGARGLRVRINVVNLAKSDSLYNYGMRPLMYSEKEAAKSNVGWHRTGTDVCYFRNPPLPNRRHRRPTATLHFVLELPHDADTVYLAHCYPYTYSDLMDLLRSLQEDPVRQAFIRQCTLTQTLAGNACEMLTITAPTRDPSELRDKCLVHDAGGTRVPHGGLHRSPCSAPGLCLLEHSDYSSFWKIRGNPYHLPKYKICLSTGATKRAKCSVRDIDYNLRPIFPTISHNITLHQEQFLFAC